MKRLDKLAKIYEEKHFHPSPEFMRFLKEEVEKKSWYEKLCNFCGSLFRMEINKEKWENLKSKLNFCNLDVDPSFVYSSFVLSIIFTVLIALMVSFFYYLLSPVPIISNLILYNIIVLMIGFGFSYYLLIYPDQLIKKMRIEASSELVLTVLYMAIGLKHIPNLENAVTFAAINLPGVIGKDLRKLLWDIHVGKYTDIEDGLEEFSKKWKLENKEFSQAIDLLRTSLLKGKGVEEPIDRAVQIILESNEERMKAYTRELNNPIKIIHALGILLPVITLILFPVVTIFMPKLIKPYVLVVLYDILLPLTVFWLMRNTLQKRPYAFHVTDISEHPRASSPGNFAFTVKNKKIQMPLLPIALLLVCLISLPGIMGLLSVTEQTQMTTRLFSGLSIFWGICIGVVFYTFLSTNKNQKIKQEVEEIENEFGEAMFLLGTVMSSGQPLEVCLEKVNKRVKDQKISGLFSRILYTIRQMGVTLKEAIFNEEFGVAKHYPSKLIRSTLRIMVESTRKGLTVTASTLLAISEYLKGVKQVDEYLKELLDETTSSMKLMSSVMVPLAAGIVVGMASLLLILLSFIASMFVQLPLIEETGDVPFIGISIEDIMPIEIFLLVVGIYMIEVLVSLNIFTVQLEKGNDWVEMQHSIATSVLMGGIIFTVVLLLIYFVFGGLIQFV